MSITTQKMFDFMNISNMSYEELVAKRNNIIGFNPDNINECLEAVKEDGLALQYVKEQTKDICLISVNEDGRALLYVKDINMLCHGGKVYEK